MQTDLLNSMNELPLSERTAAHEPWAILYQERPIPDSAQAPKKRGPKRSKTEWMLIGMEADEQRKERQAAERQAAMGKILRKNSYSEVGLSTRGANDRAAQIRKSGVC
jgi:hypothetical protein